MNTVDPVLVPFHRILNLPELGRDLVFCLVVSRREDFGNSPYAKRT